MMFYGKLLCLVLILAIARVAQAATIEELMTTGELEARVMVETPAPHFQKAPILIAVEVGTPHTFKLGTRVRDFTVPGTLVRFASKFAFNETRRRGGDSWAFQTVRFSLYPEHIGSLNTPAFTTLISVETGAHGVVEGDVRLQVPPLEVEAAPGTEDLDSWVAASEFEVDESWEGVLDSYQIGDAVTRTRRFSINGVPAMAIPASPPIELNGVQVYQAPALVDDKPVGGSLEGIREERVVFTLKAGGTHTIPDYRIHWFNLKTQAVEQIDFPGRTFVVPGAQAPDDAAAPEPEGETRNLVYWGLAVLGAALTYLLLRWLLGTTGYRSLRNHLDVWRGHRRDKAAFMSAAAQQDSRRCLALLYKRMSEHAEWQLSTACAADQQLSATSAALMAHAYGDGPPPEATELKRLWAACTTPKKQQIKRKELLLNAGPSQ